MAKVEIVEIEKGVYTLKEKMPRPIAKINDKQSK
jgi:hypothetical protein